jgi:4-aminobutyrate aminotransferase/(S)-3-amino-2-methylpropionate transaminase
MMIKLRTSQQVLGLREDVVPRGVSHITSIVADRASNAELWDLEGRRYIDFTSGIAVVSTGHNHPAVKSAVLAQLEKFTHTSFNVALYPQYVELAHRLNELVPGPSKKKTLLVSTGAEAVENAVKISRVYTGRSGVLAFSGGFHGRTMMGMALTGKMAPYKKGFGPFPSEIYHARFPDPRCNFSTKRAMSSIRDLFREDIDPARIAAVIVEPVQGEGGFNIAPPEFLQSLRELTKAIGAVFVIDEIQTGFARTGRMFAHEYAGIEADIVTMAKGIAGGYPLAAVTGLSPIMDAAEVGGLGGTYAGSPVACAAALAVLDVIEDEGLSARATEIGRRITARLIDLQNRSSAISDVRALGSMVAMELVQPNDPTSVSPETARALVSMAKEKGLMLITCGVDGNVIRFLPPLTVDWAHLSEGLDILEGCLDRLGILDRSTAAAAGKSGE